MDDVVCVKVKQKGKRLIYLLTWGRVFDPVDPSTLLKAIEEGLISFGLKSIPPPELCASLSEGAKEKYFYEGLIAFARKPIPFGRTTYRAWATKMQRAIRSGKEIFVITA